MAERSRAGRNHHGSLDAGGNKQVLHTLTACKRCRKRKTKCDPVLPRCTPCEKNDAACVYYDAAKGMDMPRSYVIDLQRKVRRLEREIAEMRLDSDSDSIMPVEELVRGAGLVKIRENAESRFLGPSSGIAMTRLVMELAKSLSHTKSIKEIVPEHMARGVKERFANEAAKPLSKVYASTSSVAAPDLPSPDLTAGLVNDYLGKAQVLFPVLHEPTFRQDVKDVYNGSTDPYQNFALRMVIALGMHRVNSQWAGLADSFYLAALKYLEGTIRRRDLRTLQCFALIALYSLATPTRTASYWVVGLAAKLLQEMRMTDEATIACDADGNPLDALEVDLRRRLFYVCVNMELGLAHSLGRPSAFSVTYDHKDVKFYSDVDDIHIRKEGISPEARPTLKKLLSIHFMQMRWLQLEIRHTLYLKKRTTPVDDNDPWYKQMERKIEDWMTNYPKPGIPPERFRVEYNTMVVFLFRPSPQVPEPSLYGVHRCFRAAVENIHLQRAQIEAGSADISWIFAQQLFMAINTILWTLSYSEIRREHPREEVTRDLQTALDAIFQVSTKWPGVESALILYSTLVESCLKAYDGEATASYGVASPSNQSKTLSPQSVGTPPLLSHSPSTLNSGGVGRPTSAPRSQSHSREPEVPPITYSMSQSLDPHSVVAQALSIGGTPGSGSGSQLPMPSPPFSTTSYDTSNFFQPLPSPVPYGIDHTVQPGLVSGLLQDNNYFIGTTNEPYMPYFVFDPPVPMEGITLTQQEELMQTLETYGFGTPPSMGAKEDSVSLTGSDSVYDRVINATRLGG